MLNDLDKILHDKIYELKLEKDPKTLLNHHRLQILNKIKNELNIEGIVADIGCGDAYFGIGLAKKFPNVTRVDCIEASKKATEEVIPRNIKFYNLESRVKSIFGSFDDLGVEKYNAIFSMGALHHSRDLKKTLSSIAKALKPNGILIAQEPAMPDNTSHKDYQIKYDIIEERFDMKIKNGKRFDRFFRECEYKYCLIINGFDICLWESYKPKISMQNKLKLIKDYFELNKFKKTSKKIIHSILSYKFKKKKV